MIAIIFLISFGIVATTCSWLSYVGAVAGHKEDAISSAIIAALSGIAFIHTLINVVN